MEDAAGLIVVCLSEGRAPHQRQDYEDDEDEPEHARRAVAVGVRDPSDARRGADAAQEQQDEKND